MLEPDSLDKKLRELEDRIKTLETAARMPHTVQKGGTFALVNENNQDMVAFGKFNSPKGEEFGFRVADEGGRIVFAASDKNTGQAYPPHAGAWYDPVPKSVSGGWQTIREAQIFYPNADGLIFNAAIACAADTAAQVRIALLDGTPLTNTLDIPAGAVGNVRCWWLHPFTVGWGDTRFGRLGDTIIAYQVQRTSGTGTINAWPPRALQFVSTWFASGPWSSTTPLTFGL